MIACLPRSNEDVNLGSDSVFSSKTNAESRPAISSGSKDARTFSRISSVNTSSSAVWIYSVVKVQYFF